VRLEVDLDPELRPILGDGGALNHAFMNLCVNAVDAMPDRGVLTIRTRNAEDGCIEVLVTDTGTGMTPEVLAQALDPFFTTKPQGKGTGMGLSMVYNTVKAHKGHLELDSQPGMGTRVRLRFPSFQGREVEDPYQPGAGDEPEGQSLHVLLVDDDELIRSSLESVLEALGHTSTATASGEEALLLLGKGLQPDLVIMDMNMPGLGGAGTLPLLRAQWPAVPVLLSTGRADQSVLDLLAAHPQVTLLSKPFTMRELEAHLKRAGHT